MRRSSRDNEIRQSCLETALAERPETYGRLDVIVFGFPCQDISNANTAGKGLKGERSSIFYECMRIVRLLRPQWIIIENVPRLRTINNGRDLGKVLQEISEAGYGYQWNVLNSKNFGVPQQRERVVIVGYFGGLCPPEILFQPEGDNGNGSQNHEPSPISHCVNARSGERQDSSAETFIGKTITRCTGINNARNDNIIGKTLNTGGRGNSFAWRENYIAQTVTDRVGEIAGISRGLDTARRCVVGNAVSVPVAEYIGLRIARYEAERNYEK